jgi:Family of unknown function (DUF6519)/Right handed beta helix region
MRVKSVSARRFDLSRETFDATKHRRSVVGLQGRVTVEADSNEQRRIDQHRADTMTCDVIGPVGAPENNAGFLITGGGSNLTISKGNIYVNGVLYENETDCTLLTQPDLPTSPTTTSLNDVPGFDSSAKAFAVELLTWECDVTPTDDPSLLEKALGGPDTSARTRAVWQVVLKAQSDPGVTCKTAVVDKPPVHDGVLSAQTVPSAAARDCTLPPLAGYQGVENQLYRVEVHVGGPAGAATFKWSRENGSVVTGIRANPQSGTLGQTFNVQSIGADQTLGFADNQWVELTDDSYERSGKVGILALIQHADPAKQQITLTKAPAGPIDLARNPKVRRWDQTDPTQTSGVPTAASAWIPLENGIQVRFGSGTFQPGDYWIIPARTAINEETGILDYPLGPQPAQYAQRDYSLLAVVPFSGGNFGVANPCRPTFPPLTALTGTTCCCCSLSVGDGGDYPTLNKAIAQIANMGGKGEICILPGTYAENIKLGSLTDLKITGCGGRTILTGDGSITPVISVEDSQRIFIGSLAIASDKAPAISMDTSAASLKKGVGLTSIILQELDITVRDYAAVSCRDGWDIEIARCHIHVKQLAAPLSQASDAGFSPAIFVRATGVRIVENIIDCASDTALDRALGGIQIGGGSISVIIGGNVIEGGNGNGITLGSLTYVSEEGKKSLTTNYATAMRFMKAFPVYSAGLYIDPSGCIHVGPKPPPSDPKGNPLTPLSEGAVEDVQIFDNVITGMGGSGIAQFDPPEGMQGLEAVWILSIERNKISQCALLSRNPNLQTMPYGRGGISLINSEYVTIRDNIIVANGQDYTRSICGIWTGWSSGIVIERNQIFDNGPQISSQQSLEVGPRGGVILEFALPLLTPGETASTETGFPAVWVHENIVASPSGPALAILAMGTVSVCGNELASHGRDQPHGSPYPLDQVRSTFGGFAAFIWNLAWPIEMDSFSPDYRMMDRQSLLSTEASARRSGPLVTGDTTFNDNRVLFDGPDTDQSIMFSSVAVLALGDVSFECNQCGAVTGASTTVLFHGLALTYSSVRLSDNRFQEIPGRALLSALTLAIMNTTTDNQGTHCFYAASSAAASSLAPLLVDGPNLSLIDAAQPGSCKALVAALRKLWGR